MQFKNLGWFILAVSLFVFCGTGQSQVVPQATGGNGHEFSVGAGVSLYNMDWGSGWMVGETVWADWHPRRISGRLNGLGFEIEARDISHNRGTHPSNFRHDTAGGGLIYSWPRYSKFRPYAKFLIADGSMDFMVPNNPTYTHDTRILFAPGGGIDYSLYGPVQLRVDYEYQIWQAMFGGGNPDPQGFTFGVAYQF